MNFFESQDRVRRHTALLVVLFVLAIVGLIVLTNLLVMIVFGLVNNAQMRDGEVLIRQMDWTTFAAIGAGVSVVVLAGSLYKMMVLSGGGKIVAESLGGQLIPPNTRDARQRKLLNVVEEMAIASGTPAPPVYLLANEPGINALAAGLTPRDAIIGVTRGAIDQLSREQLQGVIAHEFSHIFNGDMRLNIRLMGALNGILILGILGYYLLYSTSYSGRRRGNDKGGAPILALAVGLMAIGSAGTFFGALIKAAVNRQREYLADASAVQFTRNPNGIADALKRIGGLEAGSVLGNPGALEVAHAFFAQGTLGFIQELFATHPPLAKRISRIDPNWDGKYDISDQPAPAPDDESPEEEKHAIRQSLRADIGTVVASVAMADAMNAIDQTATPNRETVDYARSLLSELPAAIKEAAREPYGARAVIYSLALDKAKDVRSRQIRRLQDHADPHVCELTLALMPQMDALKIKFRLPLMDLAIPALKQLSLDQYKSFKINLVALIDMDSRVDLLEWSLQKILFKHLDGQFFKLVPMKVRYSGPDRLRNEIELVLSMMAYAAGEAPDAIGEAFAAAAAILGSGSIRLLPKNEVTISRLDLALEKLEQLKPLAKYKLLKACVASIGRDQRVTELELELFRAFAGALDCPVSPRIV